MLAALTKEDAEDVPELAQYGLGLLSTLAYQSSNVTLETSELTCREESVKVAITKAGGLEAIATIMKRYSDQAEVQLSACAALRNVIACSGKQLSRNRF